MPIPWKFFFAILFIVIALVCYVVVRKLNKLSGADRPVEPEYDEIPDIANWHDQERIEARNDRRRQQYEQELRAYESTDPRSGNIRLAAHGSLVFGLFLLLLSCFTVVGTKQVGIVTSFGRPVDSLGSGIHFKMPWQKVPEMDGAIQTDAYTGDACINIRMAGDTTGCIATTARWRVPESDSEGLYGDYRGIDRVRESVVTRDLRAALNEEFGDFDPLAALQQAAEDQADEGETITVNPSSTVNLGERATSVADALEDIIDGRVELDQRSPITLEGITYDPGTQRRIDDFMAQVAQTRVAAELENTNRNLAAANRELASSVSNDPNVLVSRCLDLWQMSIEAGLALPTASNCWPNGTEPPVAVTATPPAPAG
jgi:hypothetical protein